MASLAGIVLAGGRSSRMGTPKSSLDWHGSPLLRRVCGLVARGVDGPVVVVRAPGQDLPELPTSVEVLDDPVEGDGPLRGLATGLQALQGRAERAFLCSTDLPLLHPGLPQRLAREPSDVVLPVVGGRDQPLAALYAVHLAAVAEALLEQGVRRPIALTEHATTTRLDHVALLTSQVLRVADPRLQSLCGANTAEQYAALLGLALPQVTVECFGVLARRAGASSLQVRATRLGEAALATGLALDGHVLAAVNGESTVRDPHFPLVTGDTVALLSADAGG